MRTVRTFLGCAAVLVCVTLLLFTPRHSEPTTAYAASGDDDAWQGTITVAYTTHRESDTTETNTAFSEHKVYRYRLEKRAIYSDFRLDPENEERKSWIGGARVNLTMNERDYTFQSKFWPSPGPRYPSSTEEQGRDTTASGSTLAQGRIWFGRYTDQESRNKTKCHINVDAQADWRDRPELKVPVTGRSWRKETPPSKDANDTYDNAVNEKKTLAPSFHNVVFECDRKATTISGEERYSPPDGSSTDVITWNLRRGPVPQVEVEIGPPKEYEQWYPQGGENEKSAGNFLDISIVAHEKGKPEKKPPVKVKKYTLKLVDVSKEKGVCLNWPPKDQAKADFDLRFDQQVNPHIKITDEKTAQEAKTKEEGLDHFMVTLESRDWGAYGKLQVTAELEDGSTVTAHVHGEPNSYALAIPQDENANHIADFWEKSNGVKNTGETSDDDERPPGDHQGDGLSLYEEYRGVRVNGSHKRLDPNRKDVFVWDVSSLGTGSYGETKLSINLVLQNEWGYEGGAFNPHVMNPNRGNATLGPVYALKLVRKEVSNGDAGDTFSNDPQRPANVPRDVWEVRINTDRIREAAGDSPQDVIDNEINNTIGHELGHASHLRHHGNTDYTADGDVLCRRPNGTVVNFLCSGPAPPGKGSPEGAGPKGPPQPNGPASGCFTIAAKGGAWSGDTSCIMRYNSVNFYEDPGGNCEWKWYGVTKRGSEGHHQAPGTTYCQAKKGTGINDTSNPRNMAGDATFGECTFDLCINSSKH